MNKVRFAFAIGAKIQDWITVNGAAFQEGPVFYLVFETGQAAMAGNCVPQTQGTFFEFNFLPLLAFIELYHRIKFETNIYKFPSFVQNRIYSYG
jgi:hypothetical protein